MRKLHTPLSRETIASLRAGDELLLDGVIYTARDVAHQRLALAIKRKKKLPIPLAGEIIYYCGPTPAAKNRVIGSCGPTTSARMDEFTPALLTHGLSGMIGKGSRSLKVREAIKRCGAVYFLAIGGAGALLSTKVKQAQVVAYPDLGPEAIHRLKVEDFPLIVGIDCHGRDIFVKRRSLTPLVSRI